MKALPEWSDEGRVERALDHLLEDMGRAPLVKEKDIDRIVMHRGFTLSDKHVPFRLSETQTQILHLMSKGYNTREITKMMAISMGSVQTHIIRARARLRCRTNEEAISVAIGAGLFPAQQRDGLQGDRMNARGFTERLSETVLLMAEGYTNKEIAERLGITAWTVKDFVEEICQLLGARNRTHAVALAFATGKVYLSDSRHKGEKAA